MYSKLLKTAQIILLNISFLAIFGQQVDLNEIKPLSESPITRVPQYVFENCNQVTCHTWSPEYLATLRAAVSKITKPKLYAQIQKKYPDVNQESEYTKAAEGYDWIHGLNNLEANYLTGTRFIDGDLHEVLKEINSWFSRLIETNPGNFRARDIVWEKRELSILERAFISVLDNLDNPINRTCLISKTIQINGEQKKVVQVSVKKLINLIKRSVLKSEKDGRIIKHEELNWEEITSWVNEKDYKDPSVIDQGVWISKRIHIFPTPEKFANGIDEIASILTNLSMHPIRKAALVWYHVVRLHLWHEANKRTGKALASIILLQNGYLPPIIREKDAKRYTDIFIRCFEQDNPDEFVNFVAELVQETQLELADLTVVHA